MNSLEAKIRDNKTKGQLNAIRNDGGVPGIIYGGKDQNQKVSISKKLLKTLIEKENFLSNIITLNVDGKSQNVLPREVKYHIISDEPTHVDFLRVLPGVKIKIEVPVNFINHEKSPGLKRGGVLNIVRRKVELKCPSEKIPESITLDLDGIDIGSSFKISSVKLDAEVTPTIQGRDFVIATLAAPTVRKSQKNQQRQKLQRVKKVLKERKQLQLREINQLRRAIKKRVMIKNLQTKKLQKKKNNPLNLKN